MRFEFATATKIIFGAGTLSELEQLVGQFGNRALVVTGSKPKRAKPLIDILDAEKVAYTVLAQVVEPTIEQADHGAATAKREKCDFVVAMGGGSVVDLGKAIAALLTNEGSSLDYLEVVGKGKPIRHVSAPFIAIPTTAGTGSEVTSNAVLSSSDHHVKVSLRSPLILPRLAVVDSTLTHSSPPEVTAQSGLDALTQVIEPFVSNKANPITDALCREGIQRAGRSLRRVYQHGEDAEARESMALVSLFGGLALSNAKLGAVHGFAGPFGGMYDAPHGAICARLLPFVMAMNIRALRERQPDSLALRRYHEIGQLQTGDHGATAEDGVRFVRDLCAELNIRPLADFGLTVDDFPNLIEKAETASSMQGNPIKLTQDELQHILEMAV